MNTFRAVAVFPYIEPANFEKFCELAKVMMAVIEQQESILRYDFFFSQDNTRCTILEEYTHPEAVFEHVKKNTKLLQQLTALGGKIEGNVFPMGHDGEALQEIKNNWDSTFHHHHIGKVN
jgi:quinol monooxygenase YgiN